MSGKQLPLIIKQESGVDYIPGELVDAKVETSDAARAAFDLAKVDSPGGALWDIGKAAYLDSDGPELSPEELNQKYGLEDVFKAPMTDAAAAVIAERANIRKQSEEVLAKAEQGLITSTATFGASIAANMMDPLNLAADIAVGAGLGTLAKSAKIAMLTNWGAKGASIGRRFTEAAVEGALGNLAVEPLVFGARSLENKERALDEVAMETIAGALAFPAVKFGGEAILSRGLKFWNSLDTRSVSNIYKSAKAQLIMGKKINIEPLTREQVRMTSDFQVPEGKALFKNKTSYYYEPKSKIASGDKFYISVTNNVDNLEGAKFGVFSDDYGGQVSLTDNGFAANGASARLTAENKGFVLEAEISPDAKLLNLEQPISQLDETSLASFKNAYEEATGLTFKFDENTSLKQIYDDLHDGVINEKYRSDVSKSFNDKIKEAGYDGYIHNGSKLAGMDHNPHNVISAFNSDKINITNKFEADSSFVKSLTPEEKLDILKQTLNEDSPGLWDENKSPKDIEAELKSEDIDYSKDLDLQEFRELDPDKINEEIEAAYKNERLSEEQYKKFTDIPKEKEALFKAEEQLFNCIHGVGSNE